MEVNGFFHISCFLLPAKFLYLNGNKIYFRWLCVASMEVMNCFHGGKRLLPWNNKVSFQGSFHGSCCGRPVGVPGISVADGSPAAPLEAFIAFKHLVGGGRVPNEKGPSAGPRYRVGAGCQSGVEYSMEADSTEAYTTSMGVNATQLSWRCTCFHGR